MRQHGFTEKDVKKISHFVEQGLDKKFAEKLVLFANQEKKAGTDYSDIEPLLWNRDAIHVLDFFAFELNNIPHDDPKYILVEMLENLLTEPLLKTDWVATGRGPIVYEVYDPAPGSALHFFNRMARDFPFWLQFEGHDTVNGNGIKICATHQPFVLPPLLIEPEVWDKLNVPPEVRDKLISPEIYAKPTAILWYLWRCYFEKIDLRLLKRCAVCGKWFADRSKNKQKTRCSQSCTDKYWSYGRRKASNHDLSSQHNRKRGRPQSRKKGSLRKP